MLIGLIILAITFFILTLYSVVQTNMTLLHIKATYLFSLRILDTSSAATLFVTLLGALLVRHQFALGLLPRINYSSTATTKNSTQRPSESYAIWRVEIRNTGLGSAIINRAEYLLERVKSTSDYYGLDFEDTIEELAKIGLVRDDDYWMDNITTGYSLVSKDDCFIFEIKMEHIEKIKRFNMVLYFQGQLGDRYSREIFLIPRT